MNQDVVHHHLRGEVRGRTDAYGDVPFRGGCHAHSLTVLPHVKVCNTVCKRFNNSYFYSVNYFSII
jgi:hypothetical protein